jgi:hypothetical protein
VRIWWIAGAVMLALTLLAALALATRGGGQGVIPDRLQPSAPAPPADQVAPQAPAAQCRGDAPRCREVSGRIVYVEAVDPDGDGDAHFVLADLGGVTGPGITVVDVRADLRPQPLPGIGDHLSAAGPVATGSHGQQQIEAVRVGG